MPNYKIEGNVDFYGSLYSSLDYDSDQDKDNDQTPVCEISGQKLLANFVTLECKHAFNYDALYTEICKQKFDFLSYTTDFLSKKDIQKIRDSNLDYYIKCPYCRHIQFTVLPFYDDLLFQKKYGVNTTDVDYRVVKTSYIPSTVPSNYTYMLYGYKFVQGKCCKLNLVNGKTVPCYNCYATSIVAPDGSTKLFCPNHVRAEVKAFKLEINKKKIEAKLLEKAAKSAAKKEAKSAAKSAAKESPTLCLNCCCVALLKTGPRKGEACGQKATSDNNLCKRHTPK